MYACLESYWAGFWLQGGDSLLSTVEEIRALAKSARHDDADAWGPWRSN